MTRFARVLFVLLLSAAPLSAQQPPPPKPAAAQDAFVPVDSPLNQQETIPAARLVGIAYGFIWIAILVYVIGVARGLARVRGEMDDLRKKIDRSGS